jgi:glycine cleavage system H protein
MSLDPQKLLYTSTHEWIYMEDAPGDVKTATVGLSDFAIHSLTDLVHVDLPSPGRGVLAGKPFGEVESVKAVSDLYSPVDGEIIEVNKSLTTPDPKTKSVNLDILSQDPYGAGWLVKIRVEGGQSALMDYVAYKKQCDAAEA